MYALNVPSNQPNQAGYPEEFHKAELIEAFPVGTRMWIDWLIVLSKSMTSSRCEQWQIKDIMDLHETRSRLARLCSRVDNETSLRYARIPSGPPLLWPVCLKLLCHNTRQKTCSPLPTKPAARMNVHPYREEHTGISSWLCPQCPGQAVHHWTIMRINMCQDKILPASLGSFAPLIIRLETLNRPPWCLKWEDMQQWMTRDPNWPGNFQVYQLEQRIPTCPPGDGLWHCEDAGCPNGLYWCRVARLQLNWVDTTCHWGGMYRCVSQPSNLHNAFAHKLLSINDTCNMNACIRICMDS